MKLWQVLWGFVTLVALGLGVSCAAPAGFAPAGNFVRAERLTYTALEPVVVSLVAAELERPLEQRARVQEDDHPRTDFELANVVGLLDDWRFSLNQVPGGEGAVPLVASPALEELQVELEARLGLQGAGGEQLSGAGPEVLELQLTAFASPGSRR